MGYILGIIRNLQPIVHAMIITLQYPASISLFFSGVFEAVTFEILPSELIYEQIFDFGDNDSPYTEQADEIGYGSRLTFINSGSISIYFFALFLLQVAYSLIALCFREEGKIHNYVNRKRDDFLWAGATNFYTDMYLCMCFAVCINVSNLDFDSTSLIVNQVWAILIAISLVAGPPFYAYWLGKYWKAYPTLDQVEGGQHEPGYLKAREQRNLLKRLKEYIF